MTIFLISESFILVLTVLTPQQKEKIARLWCSKENNNRNLDNSEIWFCDDDGGTCRFQFDITSQPQRKEIEELQNKVKEYENQHGKMENDKGNPYSEKLVSLYTHSSNRPDNNEIIGMVKSDKHDSGGNTYQSILGDCFLLTRAKANKKYMILTDKEMYDYFCYRCKTILGEIKLVYLDSDKHGYLLEN